MPTDARKSITMPGLVARIANLEVAAHAGALVTIGVGWVCLYLVVANTILLE